MSFTEDAPSRRGTASTKWMLCEDEVLPMSVADMEFKAPQAIVEALQARAAHGVYGYTSPDSELTETVVSYFDKAHGTKVDPSWIVWVNRVIQGMHIAARVCGGTGDSGMVFSPCYPPLAQAIDAASMEVVKVPLTYDEVQREWVVDFNTMEASATTRTRFLVLCNPHNPTGKVFTEHEVARLGDFCKRYDMVLASDEIYQDLVLDGHRHVTALSLQDPQALRRVISLHSPAKTYNLGHVAAAYAVIPDPALRQRFCDAASERNQAASWMTVSHTGLTDSYLTPVNAFGRDATLAAYAQSEKWRQGLIKYMIGNRDFAVEYLHNEIRVLRALPAHATFLLWIDASALADHLPQDWTVADFFLKKAKVALTDGGPFGQAHFLRLNFACPQRQLKFALERMAAAVQALKGDMHMRRSSAA